VTHPSELLARTIIIFSIFVPFFAFRELRRVIGEDKFRDLFFRMGAPAKPEAPVEASKSKHGYAVSS
jgi:hypothetical protein